MEKKFPIFKILTLLVWLVLGMGTAFAACVTNSTNVVWDGSAKEEPCLVNGYYEINTAAKLAWYAKNYTKGNAKLTADIDLGGKLWTPIAAGTGDAKYSKTFDGNGHVVKNLYVNGSELAAVNAKNAQNLAFIAVLGGGTVKNLILENVNIQASTNSGDILSGKDQQISVGAVVGWMNENASNKVEGCMVLSGTIKTTGSGQGVGGIVGNAKKGTITNCMSLVEIQTSGSDAYIGGIIGITKTEVNVTSCVYAGPGLTNTGENGLVGGIAGNVFTGKLNTEDNYYEGESINGIGGSICISTKNECTQANATSAANSIANADNNNVDFTNAEDVACAMNGTNEDGSCKEEPWSLGETGLSLNGYGVDGYKIVFDANDGLFANGKNTTNKFLQTGMAITDDEIGKPTREAYTFKGWALTRTATEPAENLGVVSQRDTVFAVWEKKIKVTFDANGGTFPDESVVKDVYITKGDPITVDGLGSLPVTYCEEYSVSNPSQCLSTVYFTGWKDNSENTIDFNNHDVLATVDVTYKAIWTNVITYSVTFHANNNTTVDIVVFVDQGTTTSRPDDPTMDGYDFDDWYDGDAVFDFGSQIESSKDLYAHWTPKQYDVIYVLGDGGLNKGDNPVAFTLGEGLLDLNPPTAQNGYAFDGWFYDSDFKQKAIAIDRNVVGDKTFYAKWSKMTYKIAYKATNDVYGGADDQFKEHGTPIQLLGPVFTFPGYEQAGWISSDNVEYALNFLYEADAPLTLFPKKGGLATYTITYECEDCNLENDTYTINDKVTLKADPAPREGYRLSWYIDQEYTTAITQVKKGSYGNLNLHGRRNRLYTITYVCEGCDVSDDGKFPKQFDIENEFGVPFPTTVPDGYKFAGWYKNASFTGDPNPNIAKGTKNNVTFYGKLNKIYNIEYVLNGSTESRNKDNYTVDDKTFTLNAPAPVDGFTFGGWYTNAEFEGDAVTQVPQGSTGDKTFYAKWNKVYPFVAHYGPAITVTEYEGGTKTAVVNGNYGAHENENEHGPGQAVEIPNDIPVNSVVMTRTFPKQDGEYSTIVLPFDVNTEKVSGVKVVLRYNGIKNGSTISMKVVWAADNVIKDANNNYVHYEHTTLNANTPYMVLMDDERDGIFEVDGGVTLKQTTPANTEIDGCNWMFHGTWKYKEWGSACSTGEQGCDKETGNAYGFAASASEDNQINIGTFVKVGKGAWIRPMRAYLVHKDKLQTPEFARANGAYVKRPTVKPEELPEIMSVVIDGIGEENGTTVIGQFNTRTGVFKMNYDRGKFDLKGRRVNGSNNARGAYYGKKILKK